jgi:MFS family permease
MNPRPNRADSGIILRLKFWPHPPFGRGLADSGLALPLIAALTLGATPWQMGLLSAAGTAPILFVGLFAGVWVDRLRRRPLMIAMDIGRAAILLVIPLASALGLLRIEILYVVALLVGALSVLFDVAHLAFLPSLVGREQLVEGNSKLQTTTSVAQVAGPGLAVCSSVCSAPPSRSSSTRSRSSRPRGSQWASA